MPQPRRTREEIPLRGPMGAVLSSDVTGAKQQHVAALDGVRAIAIVAVMLLHAASDYFPGGAIGVDVFFVLSAFLITSIIIAEHRVGRFSFAGFYWRRLLRLGPALVLWLMLVAAPTAVLMGQGDRVLASTLVSLLYIGDFVIAYDWVPIADAYVHIWSLAIEEQFYFVWPAALVFLCLRHPERLRTILWCLLGAAVGVQVAAHQSGAQAYFLPWGHIVAIATGCLAAGLYAHGVPGWMNPLVRSTTVAAAVILMIGAVCLWADQMPPAASSMVLTVASIGIGLLVLHAREVRSGFVISLLTLNVMVWLGRRSYGLYLYHRTLAMLIPELLPGITLKVAGPLVLILAFLVAEASYRWVELHHARRGRRRSAHRAASAV